MEGYKKDFMLTLKLLIILLLIYIFISLGKALFQMRKGEPNMTQFIQRRLLASVLIIILVLLAASQGWITLNARPY
tara:strand:+ start:5457 stop:5684 length:228 start_codon:yes stop_codon:yes gene_type:complete